MQLTPIDYEVFKYPALRPLPIGTAIASNPPGARASYFKALGKACSAEVAVPLAQRLRDT